MCRCTTVPYYDWLESDNIRIARDLDTGKTETVKNMSFETWKNNYVGKEKWEYKHKASENYRKDLTLWNKYNRVLGKNNLPTTFEKFQEMKYNDVKEWGAKKREYNTIGSIKNKKWTDEFKQKTINAYYEFKNKGIETSDHFLSRFLNPSRNYLNLTVDGIIQLKQCAIKFKELIPNKSEYNLIRYEKWDNNFIRIISNEKDNELISIIIEKNDKSQQKLNKNKWEVSK